MEEAVKVFFGAAAGVGAYTVRKILKEGILRALAAINTAFRE